LLFFTLGDVRLKLEKGAAIHTEPHLILSHDTADLGPAGTDEWHAFITDSENNLVGLVSQEKPQH
jgi:methylmalonyl-CoA/ethylmalonyl-CoA epimerase